MGGVGLVIINLNEFPFIPYFLFLSVISPFKNELVVLEMYENEKADRYENVEADS